MGDQNKLGKYGLTALITVVFIVLLVAFFYYDRQNRISDVIQAWGIWGVAFAILLMTAICMTPIPSEGLVIMFLKVFGVYEGVFFAWIGSTFSSLVIFILVRYYGQTLMKKLISPERFNTVDNWVKGKGSFGLLVARLLPIPAFAVNYIAGAMPSMQLWTYLWTAAVSMIPYYIGTALVFLGIARATWLWLVLGFAALALFWGTSYFLNKRKTVF
ncbi:TVP38/TMEM64 family inner membrane protein YdjZ [Desulfosporosinus acididurans]|uniref:TVP38/TMEM64 family membrane protein n=1 Tax=Desulfosporosinus acididurans TaxID=476652 RepID=A0A0J1FLF4_9FIRM|nr:VTT domain-containing protein [Desulfosporosinus acididurans]KLU64310.1 TVP38/TMEM64 family inner membrane protein YdjZ [Desulfosporosinus acididurans]